MPNPKLNTAALAVLALHGLVMASEANAKAAPGEFKLFPKGPYKTSKGDLSFDEESAASVMGAYTLHGNDGSIDYEHQALQDPPVEAPAAGWYSLEVRDGDLWLKDIRWTDKARSRIEAGEYRYLSPAVEFDLKTRRVTRLINVALTNLPATRGMQPLVAMSDRAIDRRTATLSEMSFDTIQSEACRALEQANPKQLCWVVEVYDGHLIANLGGRLFQIPYTVDGARVVLGSPAVEVQRTYTPVPVASGDEGAPMKTVLSLLALSATATEAEAVTALSSLRASEEAAKQRAAAAEVELLTLTDSKTREEAKGKLGAWKGAAAQVETLSAELATIKTQAAEREAQALIAAAKADGKVAAAQEPLLLSMGKRSLEELKAFLAASPKLVPTAALSQPTAGSQVVVMLTEEQKHYAEQMGIPEKDMAEFIAKQKASASK